MKSLKENINESLTGVAVGALGAIALMLGWKALAHLFDGIIKADLAKTDIKLYHEHKKQIENVYIPKLEAIIWKHPETYKWIESYYTKKNIREILSTKTTEDFLDELEYFVKYKAEDDSWKIDEFDKFKQTWELATDSIETVKRLEVEVINNNLK